MSCQRDVRAGPGDCERSTTRRARDRSRRGRTHGYRWEQREPQRKLIVETIPRGLVVGSDAVRPFRRDPSTSRQPLDVGSITNLHGSNYAASRDIPSLTSIMGTGRQAAMLVIVTPDAKGLQEKKLNLKMLFFSKSLKLPDTLLNDSGSLRCSQRVRGEGCVVSDFVFGFKDGT